MPSSIYQKQQAPNNYAFQEDQEYGYGEEDDMDDDYGMEYDDSEDQDNNGGM
jgi:hypothetical protein